MPPLRLLQVRLALQDLAACQAFYPAATYGAFASNTNLCAFSPGAAADVCAGDSGGPLVLPGSSPAADVLVGLTSYGLACSLERNFSQPGVYTGGGRGSTRGRARPRSRRYRLRRAERCRVDPAPLPPVPADVAALLPWISTSMGCLLNPSSCAGGRRSLARPAAVTQMGAPPLA